MSKRAARRLPSGRNPRRSATAPESLEQVEHRPVPVLEQATGDVDSVVGRDTGQTSVEDSVASDPTPFTYRYWLRDADGGTDVSLDAEVESTGAAGLLGPIAGKAVRRGVDENFARLKRLLEAS